MMCSKLLVNTTVKELVELAQQSGADTVKR